MTGDSATFGIRTLAIALAALALVFLLGVVAPALGSGTWTLWIPQVLVMSIAAFITGRLVGQTMAPAFGAVVGVGALLAAAYGSYAAHASGLWGLEANEFGSDDMPGNNAVLVSLVVFGVPVALVGAIAGFVGRHFQSSSH